jgi:hypothetical protein
MKRAVLLPLLLLLWPVVGAASDGGPSPGVVSGWDGVAARSGAVRYVAVTAQNWTTVEAVRVRGGRVLRFASVRGYYGVPLVTQNGTAGGLSHDGRTLVLSSYPSPAANAVSRFAVFNTRSLHLKRVVTLRGTYSYDALSPDGSMIYLIEYSQGATSVRYRVRAYDLAGGRLLAGAIADKRLWGDYMRGFPVSRATSSDGGWVYTLYGKPDGTAFVHALDAKHRAAFCVNLPWRRAQNAIGLVKLSLLGGDKQLLLRQPGFGRLAIVDTASFRVQALRKPIAPGTATG